MNEEPVARPESDKGRLVPLKIVLAYLVIGGLWVLLSDRVLAMFIDDPRRITQLQTIKGWFFIVVTAGILYGLIYRSIIALRDSERRLNDIISFLPDATFAINMYGRVIAWNRAMEELSGVDSDDMLDMGNYEYALPFYGSRRPILIDLALRPDESIESMYPNIQRDGETLTAEVFTPVFRGGAYIWGVARPLYDHKGNIVGAIESVRDATERRMTEAELRRRQELLQLVMDNVPQFIFWKDKNSVYIGCNINFASAAGVGIPENIVGKTDYDLPWTKDEADAYRSDDREVMELDKPKLHIVETQKMAGGKTAYLETNKVPLHDAEGNVIGVLGTYEDITERRLAEEEIRQRRERERQIQHEAEEAKRQFYQGTIFSVTDGKLNLVDYDDIDAIVAEDTLDIAVSSAEHLATLRAAVRQVAEKAGMSDERTRELISAVGEAAANAVKHAGGGLARIAVKNGMVQVCIQDSGSGLDALVLPKATLMTRYSTKPSMGLGYSLILATVDKVYLATSKNGTWVLMEKEVIETVEEFSLDLLPDVW